MKSFSIVAALLLVFAIGLVTAQAEEKTEQSKIPPPATVAEARSRARLLHEMIHGTLQVVHRDFFEEDGSSPIPSSSISDVFTEMARSYDVKMRWLIVQTDVMNVDHRPQDEFEVKAVKQLGKGKPQYELVEDGRYRYAGAIRLASQCLKCHVKERTNNDDRTAGLVISMPLEN